MRLFRTLLRPKIFRPVVGISGGLIFGAYYARQASCAEIHPVAGKMQELIPEGFSFEQRDLRSFLKYSNEDGLITKEAFQQAFNELGVNDPTVIDSFFKCFDKNGNSTVSFHEFVSGVASIGSKTASPSDRLKFVFDSMDLNGSGNIDKSELRRMIHALLVTRENLMAYEDIKRGSGVTAQRLSHEERQLRKEKNLQNSKRIAYASTSTGEASNLSIFDEINRALLSKNGTNDPVAVRAVLAEKARQAITEGSFEQAQKLLERAKLETDRALPPTSFSAYRPRVLPVSSETEMDHRDKLRLKQLYQEFPFLGGLPLNDCLSSLADLISKQILKDADTNKNNVISFKEFEAWSKKDSKDAQFLFSLFNGFHMPEADFEELKNAQNLQLVVQERAFVEDAFGLW